MTCTEYLAMLNRHPRDCTRAERAAHFNHSRECLSCYTEMERRAKEILSKTPPEEALLIALVGRLLHAQDSTDPEAR